MVAKLMRHSLDECYIKVNITKLNKEQTKKLNKAYKEHGGKSQKQLEKHAEKLFQEIQGITLLIAERKHCRFNKDNEICVGFETT
jgi:predicted nuclease of restriction endonuclease-like RecB superfamily